MESGEQRLSRNEPADIGEIMQRCLRGLPVTVEQAALLSREQRDTVAKRREEVKRLETVIGVRSNDYRFAGYDATSDRQRRAKEAVQ